LSQDKLFKKYADGFPKYFDISVKKYFFGLSCNKFSLKTRQDKDFQILLKELRISGSIPLVPFA